MADDTTTTTAPAAITGPAVTVDETLLLAWLYQPAGTYDGDAGEPEMFDLAQGLGINHLDPTDTTAVTSMVDDVLAALRDDDEQDVFTLADGIDRIDIIRTYDGDADLAENGCDGVHVYVDTDTGIRLAGQHQDLADLTGSWDAADPVEAIVHAIVTIARQANHLVTEYRAALSVNTVDVLMGEVAKLIRLRYPTATDVHFTTAGEGSTATANLVKVLDSGGGQLWPNAAVTGAPAVLVDRINTLAALADTHAVEGLFFGVAGHDDQISYTLPPATT